MDEELLSLEFADWIGNILSVLRKTAYNIIRLMQIDEPKDRELVIDVIDEITDDFSIAIKWFFDPIPSFY